jgi:hypothetical protein
MVDRVALRRLLVRLERVYRAKETMEPHRAMYLDQQAAAVELARQDQM